jgi:hypothetical protein
MTLKHDHETRVAAFPGDVRSAHEHSTDHRTEVERSAACGCFYCCRRFAPGDILEWVDEGPDGKGQTAICPWCGIDSVIGDLSGFDISDEFLGKMKTYWFDT